jgi:hypothetical protein
LQRHSGALRRLLARDEAVTLVVLHEFGLRQIATAADIRPSPSPDTRVAHAAPYLFDVRAIERAVSGLDALARAPSAVSISLTRGSGKR